MAERRTRFTKEYWEQAYKQLHIYLPEATDFTGIPKRDASKCYWKDPVECPKCHGHGIWNLKLREDGTYFQGGCNQCNGWGYVSASVPEDVTCLHEYRGSTLEEIKAKDLRLFRCEHAWTCSKCGRMIVHDSSD